MKFLSKTHLLKGFKYEFKNESELTLVVKYNVAEEQFFIMFCGVQIFESHTFNPVYYRVEKIIERGCFKLVDYH